MSKGHEEDYPGLRCQDDQDEAPPARDSQDEAPPARDSQDEAPPARDSQVHGVVFPAWSELREDLDLTDVRWLDDMVI